LRENQHNAWENLQIYGSHQRQQPVHFQEEKIMKRRIIQIVWGVLTLSLIAGGFYTARGEEPTPAPTPVPANKENLQVTGTMVAGVGFDGEFYPPLGSQKKLGVLLLSASDGGIPGNRAKIFAENGFPTLALGYFKTKRTPEYLDMVPLEYFDQPIWWLTKNEYIQGGKIVVIGESKGAELALLLASRKPEISGVVAFVPSAVVFQGMPKVPWPPRSSWSSMGKPIPFVPYNISNLPDKKNVLSIYRNSLKQQEAVKKALIPVNKIKGPVLLFSAADDGIWPSVEMSDMIMRSLKDQKFGYAYEHITYDNAGHTMMESNMMGGTEEGNRKARIDSTEKMLAFLNRLSAEPASANTAAPSQ
jgi:dienelactone hydrolase